MDKIFIGIDIGLKGAIACVSDVGKCLGIWDTPTCRVNKEIKRGKKTVQSKIVKYSIQSIRAIFDTCYKYGNMTVLIEKALILPRGFNIKTNVSMGHCQGLYEGIVSKYTDNVHIIDPKDWQKYFGISGKKGDTGDQSVEIASSIFPEVEFMTKRGRRLDGRSDALLIALYGKDRMQWY